MSLDPFAKCPSRRRLVGLVVVASEEIDFQVRCLSQTGDLVPPMWESPGAIAGGFAFAGLVLRGCEANAERFDRSNGAGG